MLTDMKLKALKPTGKIYKVADQQGLYAAVTRTGVVSFRFDYRVNGRREILMIGKYDPTIGAKKPRELDELDYGISLSLAEARLLLTRAHRSVEQGESPSRSKVEKRTEAADALTFGSWAEKYFAEADLAESTRAMRKSVYDRNLADEFGRLKLEEISPVRQMARCEKIKERGAFRSRMRRGKPSSEVVSFAGIVGDHVHQTGITRHSVAELFEFRQLFAAGADLCRRKLNITATNHCFM